MRNVFNWLTMGNDKAQRGKSSDAVPTLSHQGHGTGNYQRDKDRQSPAYKSKQKASKKSRRKQAQKSKRINRRK